MASNLDRIEEELRAIRRKVSRQNSPQGEIVAFDYCVESGSLEGKTVRMGIGMQGSETYPEIPPHWVHVSPPIADGREGVIHRYEAPDGTQWIALSRPPGAMWDQLPTKHMIHYMNEHIRRFWNGI